MSDVDMEDAISGIIAQPIVNPDAQATVSDFLDYTEFFPSDLVRSLTLIGKLDHKYHDATARIHELTRTYGSLPQLSADAKPDPQDLRRQISHALDEATQSRESAFSEARRLFDVAEKHAARLSIIKRKLHALPKPPSRDPTPVPVSPQTSRRRANSGAGPRLTLHLDGSRHRSQVGAGRQRNRKTVGRGSESPALSPVSWEDESELSEAEEPIKIKLSTTRRPRGVPGTNAHSAVAGISTSNAILQLSPPPPDAQPGSRHAPWLRLSEYEMAILRKEMKKNAKWDPSETMINRELAKKGRGRENYEKAKARAKARGESLLDESVFNHTVRHPIILGDRISEDGTTPRPYDSKKPKKENEKHEAPERQEKVEKPEKNEKNEKTEKVERAEKTEKGAATRRLRDDLDEANRRVAKTADFMTSLFTRPPGDPDGEASPTTEKRAQGTRSMRKRKRDGTPPASAEGQKGEAADAPADSITRSAAAPKKLKLGLPPLHFASLKSPTPLLTPPIVVPGTAKTMATITVPLAPAGPSTPSAASATARKGILSSAAPSISPPDARKTPVPVPAPASLAPAPTAAASRSRRSSLAPKPSTTTTTTTSTTSPDPAPRPSVTNPTAPSIPHLRLSTRRAPPPRPSSAAKAASAEPPSKRDRSHHHASLRRGSNASLPSTTATTTTSGSTRSLRVKKPPPPRGRRANHPHPPPQHRSGNRRAASEGTGDDWGGEGGGGPYCICKEEKDALMIGCDGPECETEWFHVECLGLGKVPPKRDKWFCADCRAKGWGAGGRRR